jgi:RNA-directed DNA polymerase
MSLVTPEKIRSLQRKLYRKAKAEPAFRFYVLYDKICREDILRHAYALARDNAGAAGVDGMTFAQIEAAGVEAWLAGLREELVSKTYRPDPVRRVMIPKPNGGGERALGIPTIRDRVIQTAAKLVLEPIFEADFEDNAYGYRPARGAVDAVKEVNRHICRGTRTWSTPICPNTSIRFHTAISSSRWLVGSWTGMCCGSSSCG